MTQTKTFGSVVSILDDFFALEPFDTSLGTLTQVAITVTLTGTVSVEATDLRTSFSYVNVVGGATAQMNGPDNITMQTVLTTPYAAGDFAPGDAPALTSATGPVSNTVDSPKSDFGSFEIPSPALVTINIVGIGWWAAQTDPPTDLTDVGDVPGSLSLAYTYTPVGASVPEPPSALLLGAGLGALGFLSFRHRRTAFAGLSLSAAAGARGWSSARTTYDLA